MYIFSVHLSGFRCYGGFSVRRTSEALSNLLALTRPRSGEVLATQLDVTQAEQSEIRWLRWLCEASCWLPVVASCEVEFFGLGWSWCRGDHLVGLLSQTASMSVALKAAY